MARRLAIRDQWLGALSLEPINDGLERKPRAGFRPRQQCRPSPQGAEKEDAARRCLPRDETPQALRETLEAEAIRRARKLGRKQLQREGLLPMKPRVTRGRAEEAVLFARPVSDLE